MTQTIADLRSREIPQRVTFQETESGLVQISVTTELASALVYLHGGHVANYQPTGSPPVLFMSACTHLIAGKAIRGGVPIIFPWFGGRAGHPDAPAHGFARTTAWELESLQCQEEVVTIVLRLTDNEQTKAIWPHEFTLRYHIRIGTTLEMALEVENRSSGPFEFEEALHTYLTVSDVREVSVVGLAGTDFIDKVDATRRKTQGPEPIRITGETDRVYLHTHSQCVVDDPGFRRQITVGKSNSASTVVWNPWIAKAKAMADFGDEEWPGMLCVETANVGENRVSLAAGGKHLMSAVLSVTP